MALAAPHECHHKPRAGSFSPWDREFPRRVDQGRPGQLALWAPLCTPFLQIYVLVPGPFHPHPWPPRVQDPDSPTPPSWQPKPPLSLSCTLMTRFSCLVCQPTGRVQHVGIRQAEPAPLTGQDILCFLSRPLGTMAWVNTKDRAKPTSPALYQIPIVDPHKLVVLCSYPSLPLITLHRGQDVSEKRGLP